MGAVVRAILQILAAIVPALVRWIERKRAENRVDSIKSDPASEWLRRFKAQSGDSSSDTSEPDDN